MVADTAFRAEPLNGLGVRQPGARDTVGSPLFPGQTIGGFMQTLIERLRTDFARKTLGELIQEREAAAFEIERLTRELILYCERASTPRTAPPSPRYRNE